MSGVLKCLNNITIFGNRMHLFFFIYIKAIVITVGLKLMNSTSFADA